MFEIAVGLMNTAKALAFCHRDARLVHLDVSPQVREVETCRIGLRRGCV